jgi:hypothetical protein
MIRYNFLMVVTLATLSIASCSKKNEGVGLPDNSSSLTLVNLINKSNGFYTNFTPSSGGKAGAETLEWYSTAARIGYGGSKEFALGSGTQTVGIASVTDTSSFEWVGTFDLPVLGVRSLYFIGPDTLHIDTLLTTDSIPDYSIGDSVVGVRFIHLAQGTDPVSVDIIGGNDTLVQSLSYKGVTGFLTLPATVTNPATKSYKFEFRDLVSGNVLATYTYSSFHIFKSISIALTNNGSPTSWRTVVVNDY